MSNITESLENKSLAQLATLIRDGHEAIQAARQAARGLSIDQALNVGDAALAVKARVPSLKGWLIANHIVVSTTLLYAQLAARRIEIEIARKGDPDFSLNDARRLIAKKRPPGKAPAGTTEETLAAAPFPDNDAERAAIVEARWSADVALTAIADAAAQWTDAVWTRVFEQLEFERFLRVAPPDLLSQLERHYAFERAKQALPKPGERSKAHLTVVH